MHWRYAVKTIVDLCRSTTGHRWWSLVLALLLVLAGVESAPAQWPELERWLDGSQPLTFGLDTSSYRISTFGTKSVIAPDDPSYDHTPYRLLDPDLHGTAISFDLKLRWPSASPIGAVEPYVSVGPTLFVTGSDNVARFGQVAPRPDSAMSLGLSWGAGLAWRLSRNAELFGGYRFLQYGRDSALSHGERSESDLIGQYGIRLRF